MTAKRRDKSPYEVLGVAKEATPAEIKREYRKRAERAHPDKGGSHQDMAEVNHAYDVLKDPARRLLYDRTGADTRPAMETRIQSLIMQVFADGLQKDVPNILAHALECLEVGIIRIEQGKAEAEALHKKLTHRRNKIKTKRHTNNLFHMIVDQQLQQVEQALAALQDDCIVYKSSIKELEKYESIEDMPSLGITIIKSGSTAGVSYSDFSWS